MADQEQQFAPGTPEYQEAYDAEMKRLEAGASKPEAKAEEQEATTTSAETEAKAKAPAGETDEQLSKRLASVEKALKDTQAWGHRNAAEVARLKREAEERAKKESRPAILDNVDGLEEAIHHVAGKPETKQPVSKDQWASVVGAAIPDIEQFLTDPEFAQRALAIKQDVITRGENWDDPIVAIREFGALKTDFIRSRAATAATEKARKDFEDKQKKLQGMQMPGGSGGKAPAAKQVDEASRWMDMTPAEFQKQRAKVLGY